MKKILCFIAICAFPSFLFAANKGLPPAEFKESYTSDGHSCSLKLKNTFVALSRMNGSYGEKLEYSVYCDGTFLHPEEKEAGTLIGCRQPYTTPKDRNPITKAMFQGKQIGWWIDTKETCGTQSLNLYALIIPKPKDGDYQTKKIISNYLGVVINQTSDPNKIGIWYSQYIYCGAGATSIPVPLLTYLDGEGKLPSDLSTWPTEFKPSYVRAFLAGMADKNVKVLEAAKSLLNEKSLTQSEPCIAAGVPRTQQQLDEIIQSMKILDKNKVTAYLSRPFEN